MKGNQVDDSKPKHLAPESKARRHPIVFILIAVAVIAGLVVGEMYARPYLEPLLQGTQGGSSQAGTQSSTQGTQASQSAQDATNTSSEQQQLTPEEEAAKKAAEEAAAAEAAKPKEPVVIEAMMIGDILMHDPLVQSGAQEDGSYNYDFLYEHIKPYIDAADMRLLNQETVMGNPENGFSMTNGGMGPIMNSPTALADSEARFGFNIILNSHNHTYDQGYEGLAHEMDYWKAHYPNIPVLGVNNPHAAAGDNSQNYVDNLYTFEKDGFKIVLMNHTYDTNEHPDPENDGKYVSYMTEERVRSDVQKARDMGADLIVACPHWGEQYTTVTSEEENTFSKLYTELGVDLIFGCHPHILQRVEMLRNAQGHRTLCFYSMGNYVASLMSPECLIGGIARATFIKEPDGTARVAAASLVPTVICNTYGPNMTAFPILDYTEEIAAQNSSGMSFDGANAFCSEVFGPNYDVNTGVYTQDMNDLGRLV